MSHPVKIAKILLPLNLPEAYDYSIPPTFSVLEGQFVEVPLRNKLIAGLVWSVEESQTVEQKGYKIQPIKKIYDCPPLSKTMKDFIHWVSKYTLSSPGLVLKMVMSSLDALSPLARQKFYKKSSHTVDFNLTAKRKKILDFLADEKLYSKEDLSEKTDCSYAIINKLEQIGAIDVCYQPFSFPFKPSILKPSELIFSSQQEAAIQKITEIGHDFSVTLLDGVTGSGKTEVYFEAIYQTLLQHKQVLILLPEIALTAQWLERFKHRFGVEPALWHSDVSPSKKRITWRAIIENKVQVVVGARSSLFLPFKNLGRIIIDEEHESSFKQEDHVLYHARDMAVVRAKYENIPLLLASATPSLESLMNVEWKKYHFISLPKREAGGTLPTVLLIDLREDTPPSQKWISNHLQKALEETLSRKEQSLLFLNRRGYAPLTVCRSCGYHFDCLNCSTWLVEHKKYNILQCHHCGHTTHYPKKCPNCSEEGPFGACGPGVERLWEETNCLFPDASIEVVTSDTLTSQKKAKDLVEKMTEQKIDILIGTQILAKGYHFPNLTLVGVIDADLGFAGGDPRAAEKTFQLLHQVSGRAGRENKKGQVLLQTWQPNIPVLQAILSGQKEQFITLEKKLRSSQNLPPFGRLASLIISSADDRLAQDTCLKLAKNAPINNDRDQFIILGPAPAPISLLRGKFRKRFLIKAGKKVNIQQTIKNWITSTQIPQNVRVQIDIDPYSFY